MKASYDVAVVGGGPAGLAAAISASESGAQGVLLLERNQDLGGILNQCIHAGFGLHYFGEELTGPEYAQRFIDKIKLINVDIICGSMVLEVEKNRTIHFIHPTHGYQSIPAKAVVLAMGSRERSRGAVGIPGTRPAGIFTAGAAQLYMNIEGFHIGKKAVVLGSGDIGLIMARRMTLEGAEVAGVFELMPYSGGLARNIAQCLDDFSIPLHLSHTITDIKGDKRVQAVVVQQVTENRVPIEGTQRTIECDTLLLSVGLIPENELTRSTGAQLDPRTRGPVVFEDMQTSLPGIFACGNVAHIHDLVDFVTAESVQAGKCAAKYCIDCPPESTPFVNLKTGNGVSYALPQKIRIERVAKSVDIFFRTNAIFKDVTVCIMVGTLPIAKFKREHMAPGEMEKVTLPKILLEKAGNNDLTIEIVEEGAIK